jgi:hypothetical protein
MVSATNPRHRDRPASTVLVVLIIASVPQVPPIGVTPARPNANAQTVNSCNGCCGSNCQCAGDCCGDRHVERIIAAPPQWSAAERVSRDRDCQKNGWLLPTANTSIQPWISGHRTLRLRTTRMHLLELLEVACRWRRPAISQSNPRAPPFNHPSLVALFIG